MATPPSATSEQPSVDALPVHSAEAIRRRRHRTGMMVLLALAVGTLVYAVINHFGWSNLQQSLQRLPTLPALVAMAALPLFGFSIVGVYLVAGAKFGLFWGGVAITAATAVHLLGSHLIARTVLRGPIERLARRRGAHLPVLPASENASVALMVALIPGPPYFLRNYALALTNIPLREYFWICLPVYVVRSYVTLALGDLGREPSTDKLLVLAAVYLVKLSICAVILRRLKRRLKGWHVFS